MKLLVTCLLLSFCFFSCGESEDNDLSNDSSENQKVDKESSEKDENKKDLENKDSSKDGAKGELSCGTEQHEELGECVDNAKACEIENGIGTKLWDKEKAAFGKCELTSCTKDYHAENGKCLSDIRQCDIANGNADDQKWDGAKWSECEINYCDDGYGFSKDKKSCVEFTASQIDLKGCKAKEYRDTSLDILALTDQIWCGDLPGRFNKKPGTDPNDFIYDNLLKGYWSKENAKDELWLNANSYCQKLGIDWELPEILSLLSLFTENADLKQGHINPIFDDTNNNFFWSKTDDGSLDAWSVGFEKAVINYGGDYTITRVSNISRARCFRIK